MTDADARELVSVDGADTHRAKFMRFIHSPWLDPFKFIPGHKMKGFSERKDLIFIGDGSSVSDVHAIRWYIHMVAPEVEKGVPGIKLNIVGDNWDHLAKAHSSSTLVFHGRPKSTEAIANLLGTLRAYISPFRTSTGVNVNNVVAMGMGLPVITTPAGATGMCKVCDYIVTYNPMDPFTNKSSRHGDDDVPLLMARDVYDFSSKIKHVYYDEQNWKWYSSMGYAHVNNWFNKKEGAREIDEILRGIF